MDIKSRFQESWKGFKEKLEEQQWYREAKAKWEEMDPEARRNARIGIIGGSALVFGLITLNFMWSVSKQRSSLNDKMEILSSLRNASEEMRNLRRNNHPAAADVQPNWPAYFKGKATTAGMDPGAVSVSPEKKGNPGTSTTESMYELQLKRINVRQLTQFAYYVENGDQPVKLKNLKIETDGNEGYLNASLDISSFALKKEDDNDTPKPREHH